MSYYGDVAHKIDPTNHSGNIENVIPQNTGNFVLAGARFDVLNENPLMILMLDGAYSLPFQDDCNTTLSLFDDLNEIGAESSSFFELNSIPEMIERIESVFGLNPTQISRLLGISRASFYNHKNGKELPSNREGYDRLHDLAVKISNINPGSLKQGLKTLSIGGKTLLEKLQSTETRDEEILNFAKAIFEKQRDGKKITASTAQKLSLL